MRSLSHLLTSEEDPLLCERGGSPGLQLSPYLGCCSVRLATGKRTEDSSAEQNRGVKFIGNSDDNIQNKTESIAPMMIRGTGGRGCRP